MFENGHQRLASWKEIAAHVGRDVRTVLRWEKTRGLPVHRVPGATGRVVFAYTDELDAWLTTGTAPAPPAPSIAVAPWLAKRPLLRWWIAMAAILITLTLGAWRVGSSRANDGTPAIRATADAIVATGSDGTERWRYAFPADERQAVVRLDARAEIPGGKDQGILAATSHRASVEGATVRSGQLLWIGYDGSLRRAFSFEDRPAFNAGTYGAPWALTDFRVDTSTGVRRVALAGHHYQWWPSLVTVLDDQWNRHGTFVNAGWVERVLWVGRNRLVIAGFSNALDGGMIALLDTNALDGQSPAAPGSAFACTSCGSGAPVRYIVLPRSEVNRASASPFNRTVLDLSADGLVARTVEIPASAAGARASDALYEFTPSLDLVRASYSDRYWEAHRALEAEGKITHTRAQCPDRDGPREIHVWEPATGWTIRATRKLTADS